MSKALKIAIIIAIVLVVFGVIVVGVSSVMLGFDFTALNDQVSVTNSVELDESFDNFNIDLETADLHFLPSDDGVCRIDFLETDKIKHTARVENGTLIIDVENNKEWYDNIGVYINEISARVYLPKREYGVLSVETDTGDINIPADFSFLRAEISTDTGDSVFLAKTAEALSFESDTGDIRVEGVSPKDLMIETDTGDIRIEGVSPRSLSVETDTGDLLMKDTIINGKLSIGTDTGDIKFDGIDAESIEIKTATGDVSGTLLSDKTFFAESDTGVVDVPNTSGGKCEIVSNTGDIEISIK